MIRVSRYGIVAVALAIGLAATVPVQAQRCGKGGGAECSPLVKEMKDQLGRIAADYWTPKLNDYKVRIDRTLVSDDLEALNRLRVRFAVLLDEGLKMLHEKKNPASVESGSDDLDVEMDMSAHEGKIAELMEIFTAAQAMAGRYHDRLDGMGDDVLGDLSGFVTTVADRADKFATSNRSVLAKDNKARDMMPKRKDMEELATELRSGKYRGDFMMVYGMAVEPILMLYNGTDLTSLITGAGSFSKPLAGLELPDYSALKQNFPNPATSTTTISFKVTDPASSAVIRVFDGRGELVGIYDQGARATGDHSAEIDVSKLASGSYLYHLTLETAKGPRVYSKTMQVVH